MCGQVPAVHTCRRRCRHTLLAARGTAPWWGLQTEALRAGKRGGGVGHCYLVLTLVPLMPSPAALSTWNPHLS